MRLAVACEKLRVDAQFFHRHPQLVEMTGTSGDAALEAVCRERELRDRNEDL